MLAFTSMKIDDLPQVAAWLVQPHVARWYLAGSTLERELDDMRDSISGIQAVHLILVSVLLVSGGVGGPIGWCQWYPGDETPDWAEDVGAQPGDLGIDYAIGELPMVGRGVGTQLIAGLVERIRREHPMSGILADPDARNIGSRRVLEKNGFELLRVKPIPSESTEDPMAIYRLAPAVTPGT